MVDCLAVGRAFVAEERVERRLAAILCADVAGYSRLMGVDEEGTLALLKSDRRELIDPPIAQHRGRIFKTTGDLPFRVSCVGSLRMCRRSRLSVRHSGSVNQRSKPILRSGFGYSRS